MLINPFKINRFILKALNKQLALISKKKRSKKEALSFCQTEFLLIVWETVLRQLITAKKVVNFNLNS